MPWPFAKTERTESFSTQPSKTPQKPEKPKKTKPQQPFLPVFGCTLERPVYRLRSGLSSGLQCGSILRATAQANRKPEEMVIEVLVFGCFLVSAGVFVVCVSKLSVLSVLAKSPAPGIRDGRHPFPQHNTAHSKTVPYNAVQCNAMQCSALDNNALQHNALQCSAMQ